MDIKEVLRKEKEKMTPLRRKINYRVVPIYLGAVIGTLAIVMTLLIINEQKFMPVFFVWLGVFAATAIGFLACLPAITKKETELELESFSYLFSPVVPLETDSVTIEEEDILYTLTKDGVRVEVPEKVLLQNGEYAGQVFDEVKENTFFLSWENTNIFLATSSVYRRVRIALGIFSTDPQTEDAMLFVPISSDVFRAVKTFGLETYIQDGSWDYLFYNPQDAFKQILTKGRILIMRNKKTGKVFVNRQGDFIGDREENKNK